MLTEHPELKTICDEHEDDLEDTVEFYRKVGGVQYVIPHPNVAPDEMLRCEWRFRLTLKFYQVVVTSCVNLAPLV